MITTSIDWKSVRTELAGKRAELFKRFVENPANISLAKEIRRLDDQILECSERLERVRNHQGDALDVPDRFTRPPHAV